MKEVKMDYDTYQSEQEDCYKRGFLEGIKHCEEVMKETIKNPYSDIFVNKKKVNEDQHYNIWNQIRKMAERGHN